MKNKLQMASEFDVELENNIRVHFKQQGKSKSLSWLMGFMCVTHFSSSAVSGSRSSTEQSRVGRRNCPFRRLLHHVCYTSNPYSVDEAELGTTK